MHTRYRIPVGDYKDSWDYIPAEWEKAYFSSIHTNAYSKIIWPGKAAIPWHTIIKRTVDKEIFCPYCVKRKPRCVVLASFFSFHFSLSFE